MMTVKEAVILCETSVECGAFCYRGSESHLDMSYQIYFFRFPKNLTATPLMYDWTTYIVSGKEYVTFKSILINGASEDITDQDIEVKTVRTNFTDVIHCSNSK